MRRLFIALSFVLCLLTSCTEQIKKEVRDMKITAFMVKSVSPSGVRGLDAELYVGIDNPTVGFTLRDIDATVNLFGAPCLALSSDPIKIKGHCDEVYKVKVHGELADGFSMISLAPLLTSQDFSACTIDFGTTVSIGGIKKKFERKAVSVEKLFSAGSKALGI